MTVELRSDLVTSAFWTEVQQSLAAELKARGLELWTVVMQPRTREVDYFSRDPKKYGLSPRKAKSLDCSTPIIDVDEENKVMTIVTPDTESLIHPFSGQQMTAAELAETWAGDLQLLIRITPARGPQAGEPS